MDDKFYHDRNNIMEKISLKSSLSKGVYDLEIILPDNKVQVFKIIK
jgi:hypothetical protein